MRITDRSIAAGTVLVLAACASEPSHEPSMPQSVASATLSPSSLSDSRLPGFSHSVEISKMHVGMVIGADRVTSLFERVIGTDGVLALGPNGSGFGIPNGEKLEATVPFRGTGEAHSAQTLDYFVGAGLPRSQVDHVDIHAAMIQGGTSEEFMSGRAAPPVLEGYSSILNRALDGVPVRGSFAWARFTGSGTVDAEGVFWPPLDRKLLEDAKELQRALASSQDRRRLLTDVLPKKYANATPLVVIRHSPPFQLELETAVAVEFPDVQGADTFLPDGSPLRFRHQRQSLNLEPRPVADGT